MSDHGGWASPDPDGERDKAADTPAEPVEPLPSAPPPPRQNWGGVPKPGVIPLRPLAVGEILDGSITTIRRHAASVLGVSAAVAVVSALLSLASELWVLDDLNSIIAPGPAATRAEIERQAMEALPKALGSLGISAVITMLTQTFLAGFLTVVLGKAVLGRPVTFAEAMAEAKPRWLPLLGLTLVYSVLVAVPFAVGFLLVGLLGASGVIFLLAAIPLSVFLYVRYSLATPALILEQGKIGTSLTRSARLVTGMWARVFGILLLVMLIGVVISLLVNTVFTLISGNSLSATAVTTSAIVFSAVGQVIAQTFVTPFTAGATALLYIDQRMRREGMDLELIRAAGQQPR
ncbi:hypothetical protein [Amycolatopsis sp. CA-230715]|uniref:hypothetical protein n=1 Tax=Amycolatopsis sp. CA-230715 TaxID=2745196 RepID=UPI001C021D28|nr:hypothetical protein [Amycolatopsis sp. CA-230715]QWF79140.1 hypothetical protein HUW46_02547 [Amycolatopsis sp. CA-230715]